MRLNRFCSVQADRAQFEDTCLLGKQEHLDEEILQFGQERASKCGKRIVIGMQVTYNDKETTATG